MATYKYASYREDKKESPRQERGESKGLQAYERKKGMEPKAHKGKMPAKRGKGC